MADNETLDEYVSGIRSTVAQLGALGIIISNDEKVAVFIVGLTSSFDSVTSNIFMESEIEFDTAVRTVKDFYELKRGGDRHLKASSSYGGASTVQANIAKTTSNASGSNSSKKVITCHRCHKKGHYANQCTNEKVVRKSNSHDGPWGSF
jgi:cytochrome c553